MDIVFTFSVDMLHLAKQENRLVGVCAPMVRYGKLPFRLLVRHYQVPLAYTPMIVASDFLASPHSRDTELQLHPLDQPLIAQVAANNNITFSEMVSVLAPNVSAIDLNCGCPQQWAMSEGYGAVLLSRPDTMADMFSTAKRLPVKSTLTVKVRVHESVAQTVAMVQQVVRAGAEMVAVHGRTVTDSKDAPVRYEQIQAVVDAVSVPVLANGSVYSYKDAELLQQKTGCHGIMVARGLLSNPQLFDTVQQDTLFDRVRRYCQLAAGLGLSHRYDMHHIHYMTADWLSGVYREQLLGMQNVCQVLDWLDDNENEIGTRLDKI